MLSGHVRVAVFFSHSPLKQHSHWVRNEWPYLKSNIWSEWKIQCIQIDRGEGGKHARNIAHSVLSSHLSCYQIACMWMYVIYIPWSTEFGSLGHSRMWIKYVVILATAGQAVGLHTAVAAWIHLCTYVSTGLILRGCSSQVTECR